MQSKLGRAIRAAPRLEWGEGPTNGAGECAHGFIVAGIAMHATQLTRRLPNIHVLASQPANRAAGRLPDQPTKLLATCRMLSCASNRVANSLNLFSNRASSARIALSRSAAVTSAPRAMVATKSRWTDHRDWRGSVRLTISSARPLAAMVPTFASPRTVARGRRGEAEGIPARYAGPVECVEFAVQRDTRRNERLLRVGAKEHGRAILL
jgi:hypothetical protein